MIRNVMLRWLLARRFIARRLSIRLTADGKKSVNERRVRATMKTIDDTEEPVEEEIDDLDFSMF